MRGAARPTLARPTLLLPRERPGRPLDLATRAAFIAGQRGRGRRLRHLLRSMRLLGTLASGALILAAGGITAAAGAHALRTTPLLAVTDVGVLGARRVPEAAVLAAAAIDPGTSLLALDPAEIGARVAAVPGIQRVRVIRELPHRVVLSVDEREPYALVNLGGAGGLAWIDAEGRLVGRERHGATPGLPILSGVEPPPTDGRAPIGDRLRAGLAVLRALQRAGGHAASRISEVDLGPADGPVLYLTDGVAVWLGGEGWDARLARLDAVLGGLEEQGEAVESIDLRFRDLVVLRPRGAAAGARPSPGKAPLAQKGR